MALARVVAFENVDKERIDQLREEVESGERPEGLPATEIMMLHDPDENRALVILFFESDEDYKRGDETLNAMPAGETPGRRASVSRYDVALRTTA